MQLKYRVLAMGLSVLLLCLSAWASVCELSCSLSHVYPVSGPTRGCSATGASRVGTSETSISDSHCGHANRARPSSAANHSFEKTSKCTIAPCAQVQTLSSPVNGRDGIQPGGVYLAVPASIAAVASNILLGGARHERALAKLPPLELLAVNLRI